MGIIILIPFMVTVINTFFPPTKKYVNIVMNIVTHTPAKCWYNLSRNTRLQDKVGAVGNTAVRVILGVGMLGAGSEMHGKIRHQS